MFCDPADAADPTGPAGIIGERRASAGGGLVVHGSSGSGLGTASHGGAPETLGRHGALAQHISFSGSRQIPPASRRPPDASPAARGPAAPPNAPARPGAGRPALTGLPGDRG